jgi:hypothetical protein
MLLVALWINSSTGRVMQRIDVDATVSQRSLEVESLAEIVSDSTNPRALAEWMIDRRDADRALESSGQAAVATGAGR